MDPPTPKLRRDRLRGCHRWERQFKQKAAKAAKNLFLFGRAYKGTSLANCSRIVDVRSNGATAAGLSVPGTGSEKVTSNVVEGGLNAVVPTPKKEFRCS